MKIRQMSYEECREDFFVKLIKHAENKIKYWKRQKGYRCEIENNLAEAGAEVSYCQDALNALEKQIPKKVELYTNDGNFKWKNYPCPCCREMLGLNVNKRYIKFCPKCGQALDWSDSE